MKKIIAFILAALMLMGLCACGDSEATTTAAGTTAASSDAGFVFTYNGKTITLGEKMEDVLADIGKEKSYFESESCAFKGLDKQYTYADFVIYTYPVDEVDYVLEIDLTDDLVSTTEGISIGASREQVEATYKDYTYNTVGSAGVHYTNGSSKLIFIFDEETGDTLQSIQYYAITDAE